LGEYQVWQEGSHPQEIKDDDMMRPKDRVHSQQPGGLIEVVTDWS
jgi:hypothetical protein